MRLRWILGLIVLVAALALAACGGGGNEEKESPTATAQREGSPAATKAAEATATAEKTVKATKTPEAAEPSGGGADLGDIPVYPGADKVGDYSGSSPIPLVGQGLETSDYKDTKWALYETSDSVDDVAGFYKDKMPDKGWKEEGWFDTSIGNGAAWGGYTRDNGDTAAWVAVTGGDGKTEIVIGTGTK